MRRAWWLLLPRPVRELPADLAAVIGLVLLTDLVVLAPVLRESPLRVLVGLPLVVFLPGYAVVAALFPEAGDGAGRAAKDSAGRAGRDRGIDGIERLALAVGLSIAIVPLVGLALHVTPWGIRLGPVLLSLSGITVVVAVLAAVRRWDLPPEERFAVPYRAWLTAARVEVVEPDSRVDAALTGLLVLSVLLATGSVAYAIAVPTQGETFTEFYLLTRADGDLVAAGYPTEFVRGESKPIVVGIDNHEHRTVTYTIVIQLQRVAVVGDATTVTEARELDRLSVRLAHDETWHHDYAVEPPMTGDRLRLLLLLYAGAPPPEPTVETAYRATHLWVNVTAPAA